MAKKKSKSAAPKGRSKQDAAAHARRAASAGRAAGHARLPRPHVRGRRSSRCPCASRSTTYRRWQVPILDQGTEGACTGFGLATVAHYLLRRRAVVPDPEPVSPRMLYEMAKRYDEWPGEDYSGSSARGAMKGWHKHGVCGETVFPYVGRCTIAHDAHRGADVRRRAPAARLVLPRQPPRPRRDARGHRRDGRAVRHDDGPRGLESRRRRRADRLRAGKTKQLGGHAVAIVALRRARLLDPELLGPAMGRRGLRPHRLRRLDGQRHRRLGGAARRAAHPEDGRRPPRPATRRHGARAAMSSPTCGRTSSASATTARFAPAARSARRRTTSARSSKRTFRG